MLKYIFLSSRKKRQTLFACQASCYVGVLLINQTIIKLQRKICLLALVSFTQEVSAWRNMDRSTFVYPLDFHSCCYREEHSPSWRGRVTSSTPAHSDQLKTKIDNVSDYVTLLLHPFLRPVGNWAVQTVLNIECWRDCSQLITDYRVGLIKLRTRIR